MKFAAVSQLELLQKANYTLCCSSRYCTTSCCTLSILHKGTQCNEVKILSNNKISNEHNSTATNSYCTRSWQQVHPLWCHFTDFTKLKSCTPAPSWLHTALRSWCPGCSIWAFKWCISNWSNENCHSYILWHIMFERFGEYRHVKSKEQSITKW